MIKNFAKYSDYKTSTLGKTERKFVVLKMKTVQKSESSDLFNVVLPKLRGKKSILVAIST